MAPSAINYMPSGYDKQPIYVAFAPEKAMMPISTVPPGLAFEEVVLPPGLMEPVPPPKPLADPRQRRRICYFQNRYHHQKATEDFKPCTAGDDCEFCHAFHPRLKRRNDPKTIFCTCTNVKCSGSDTASTTAPAEDASSTDDNCDASSSCSDPARKMPSSNLSSFAQEFVPLDVEEARREMQMAVEKELKAMRQAEQEHNILDSAAEDFLQRKLRAREAQKKFASRLALTTDS
eukprot:TRINITY_DN4790_c1_g1_i1.p1 TRINITY_DN4790_c1_g1~~TRINITY_DN4790_c1_g1_i1.p1  ORF type:complete len:233 (+),score=47.88 TRINITY_DN4790_c1_g1_i1:92-790(+)